MYWSSFIDRKNQNPNRKYGELQYVALSSEPKENFDFRAVALGYFNNYFAKRRLIRYSRTTRNLQSSV